MSEIKTDSRSAILKELREKSGYIPWYRQNKTVLGFLTALVLYGLFVLPAAGVPNTPGGILIGLFVLLMLGFMALILSDELKQEWLKTLLVFCVLAVGGWMFYLYTDTEWGRLGHIFFNWANMSEPMQGGQTGWTILLEGVWLTIQIAVLSAIFSTIIGLLLAVFRTFNNPVLNIFIVGYIDFFRAMPIIVLMVLIYYALPYSGIRLSAMVSGVIALSLNSAAYVSEIFRAGIESVKHGQIEAARALGLSTVQTMRMVILPQAFKVVIPPLAGNYVASAKDTAVCSAIAILELLKSAMQVQAFHANPTALIVATGMYILMFVPLTRLSGVLESKMTIRRAGTR